MLKKFWETSLWYLHNITLHRHLHRVYSRVTNPRLLCKFFLQNLMLCSATDIL